MAATGFTPIYIYYSSTTANVPSAANLGYGELAINIADGYLFYKDNANAVQKIGYKLVPTTNGGTGLTSFTANGILYASSTSALTTGSALTYDGSNFQVGAIGTVKQASIGLTSVLFRMRERDTINCIGLTTNMSDGAVQDNSSLSSWKLRLGPGSTTGTDTLTISRSPAGSSTFAEFMRVTSTGGVCIGTNTDLGLGNLNVNGIIKTLTTTVASLPSASTVGAGSRAFVTDAATPVFGSAVTGGGSTNVPVYSNGSAWYVG